MALTRLERLSQGKQSLEQYIATFLNPPRPKPTSRRKAISFVDSSPDSMTALRDQNDYKWQSDLDNAGTHQPSYMKWESSHNVYKVSLCSSHPRLSPGIPMDVDKKEVDFHPNSESTQTYSPRSVRDASERSYATAADNLT